MNVLKCIDSWWMGYRGIVRATEIWLRGWSASLVPGKAMASEWPQPACHEDMLELLQRQRLWASFWSLFVKLRCWAVVNSTSHSCCEVDERDPSWDVGSTKTWAEFWSWCVCVIYWRPRIDEESNLVFCKWLQPKSPCWSCQRRLGCLLVRAASSSG